MDISIKPETLVQCHLFDMAGNVYNFKRSDETFWGPVSGKVKADIGETNIEALVRELKEETLNSCVIFKIFTLGIEFLAQTPISNRLVRIYTYAAFLPSVFDPKKIKLNGELSDFKRLTSDHVPRFLARNGTREAYNGFLFLTKFI